MRHFAGHENITGLLDMEAGEFAVFNEIYLTQELMEADLSILYLPDLSRFKVYPFSQRFTSRFETWEFACKCRL
jgi:hypothetical protein